MTQVRFSLGDVSRLTGVPRNTIDRWTAQGLVKPRVGGGRKGRFRLWDFCGLFAVFVGSRYRDEGASDGRVAGVVKCLAGFSAAWGRDREHELEGALAAGRTFPVPEDLLGRMERPEQWLPGMFIEPPYDGVTPRVRELMERLDLQRLYDELKLRIARHRRVRMGRPRKVLSGSGAMSH
jgi:hypothetical protein